MPAAAVHVFEELLVTVLTDHRRRVTTQLDDERAETAGAPLGTHELLAIARQLAGSEARWRPHVVHDVEERRPVRLVVTDSYEAWVIGWTHGQTVELHDHGGAVGALVVAEGVLTERVLHDGELRARDLRTGAQVELPSGLVHEVVASSADATTSIHVYSPPLTSMAFYDQDTGVRVRTDEFEPSVDREEREGREADAAVGRHLQRARGRLHRVEPDHLEDELAAGALLVDIRPAENRDQEGELPGAVVVERIHLEWRLDPTSPDRLPEADGERRVIVVCNEGYASSLAAVSLQELGLVDATDLVGGYRAWRQRVERG